MSLPNMPYGDDFRREVWDAWGGLNLNEAAGAGEAVEALNMSSREFPALASALLPQFVNQYDADMHALHVYGGDYYWVSKAGTTCTLKKNKTAVGTLNGDDLDPDSIRYAQFGDKLVIMPCKQIYDAAAGTLSDMEERVTAENAWFRDGTFADVEAENNTLYVYGAGWAQHFKPGDAVTISGSQEPENNKTAVIREISGDSLRFYENTFAPGWYTASVGNEGLAAGHYAIGSTGKTFHLTSAWNHTGLVYYKEGWSEVELHYKTGESSGVAEFADLDAVPYEGAAALAFNGGLIELFPITVAREVPDMDFICVNENRVWGCRDDRLYASALGDPLNYNVFDGLSTDSWAATSGGAGAFTGCVSYQGYPVFFKGDDVFRVLGDAPGNYSIRKLNICGTADDKSIAEIRGRLYYLAPEGVVEWSGGEYPAVISSALGIDTALVNAAAGTDGARYYIDLARSEMNDQGTFSFVRRFFVYDTRFGTWHEMERAENSPKALFAREGNSYYTARYETAGIAENNMVVRLLPGGYPAFETVDPFPGWSVTFADSVRAYKTVLTGSESKKGILRLLIRCKVTGKMTAWISYDGGDFQVAAEIGDEKKDSWVIPLVLRRCDYWQLRLTGTRTAVIYSIAVEHYAGEYQRARQGG